MDIANFDPTARDAIIDILMNPSVAIPTDDEILEAFSGSVTATKAKWRLRLKGFDEVIIEQAFGRAVDQGLLSIESGTWKS